MTTSLARNGAALFLAICCLLTRADVPRETLNDVVKTHQNSVLLLSGRIKFDCGHCPREHQAPILSSAVVVDAKGLFLAVVPGAWAAPGAKILTSTLSVRTPDGAEVPVTITVTDKDLGVVVLALEKPEDAKKFAFKPLSLESPPRAKLLDPLILLRRHDAGFDYAVSASVIQVNALQTKPRYVYYPIGAAFIPAMMPCFDASGRLVGISTVSQGVIAPDELADLVDQARARLPQ